MATLTERTSSMDIETETPTTTVTASDQSDSLKRKKVEVIERGGVLPSHSTWKLSYYSGENVAHNKVKLYMKIKGIEYKDIPTSTLQATEDIELFEKASNGKRDAPVFVISSRCFKDDVVLTDPMAIIMFIEHYYRDAKPLSSIVSPEHFSSILTVLNYIQTLDYTLKHWKEFKLETSSCGTSSTECKFIDALKRDILCTLHAIEDKLSSNTESENGAYIVGSSCTLADCCLFPHIAWMVRRKANFSKDFPHINKWYGHAWNCDSVKAVFTQQYVTPHADTAKHVMKFIGE